MPNRIIRESMLDSSRYLSVDEGAELLFVHMMLLADDFGCLSVESGFIGRRCFLSRPSDERLAGLLAQLVRADLIRLYDHRGIHYAFIPRFRQRLKRETLANPQPPDELLADDADAQAKFLKLNGHAKTSAAGGQPEGGHPPPSRARAEGKGSEVIGSEVEVKAAAASARRNPVEMAAELAAKMRLKENES